MSTIAFEQIMDSVYPEVHTKTESCLLRLLVTTLALAQGQCESRINCLTRGLLPLATHASESCVARDDFKVKVERCTGDEETSDYLQANQPYMHLSMQGFGSGGFPAFLNAFGAECIHAVSTSKPPQGLLQSPFQLINSSAWICIFIHCINVERVHVGGCGRDVGEFLRTLSMSGYLNADVRKPDLFPKMNTLQVNVNTKTSEIFWDPNDRQMTLARPGNLAQCLLDTMYARPWYEDDYHDGVILSWTI